MEREHFMILSVRVPSVLFLASLWMMSDPQPVAIDDSEFVQARPPKKGDDAFSAPVGYVGRSPVSLEYAWKLEGDRRADLNSAVIEHSKDYAYAVHDFYRVLLWSAESTKRRDGKGSHERPDVVFTDWPATGSPPHSVVCSVQFKEGDMFHGVAGWFHEKDGQVSTVIIRYEDTHGVPGRVVDFHMKDVPSSVSRDDPRFVNWKADDIRKWADVLRTRSSDTGIAERARDQLRLHDPGAFGLLTMWSGMREQSPLHDAEIKRVLARLDAWPHQPPPVPPRPCPPTMKQITAGIPLDESEFDEKPHGLTGSGGRASQSGGTSECKFGRRTSVREFFVAQPAGSDHAPTLTVTAQATMQPLACTDSIRDFYRVFRQTERNRKYSFREEDKNHPGMRFVDWVSKEGDACGVVCFEPGKDGDASGIAAWYYVDEIETTCVQVFYHDLKGIPREVVDEYLTKYPSDVTHDDPKWKTSTFENE